MRNKRTRLLLLTLVSMLFLTGCNLGGNDQKINSGDLGFVGNSIDYLIAGPLANLIRYFAEMTSDFGFGILIVTLLIRFLFYPIYSSTSMMSAKMALAQPEIARINDKYIGKADPTMQRRKQMEVMGVYKKYKINLLGCLAPLIQMPIFIGSYVAVRRFSATYPEINTNFFGIDLSEVHLGIAIVMFALMLLQTYLTLQKPKILDSKKFQNPSQNQMQGQMKIMLYAFAGIMLFMAVSSPSALPFYWIIGSLFTIGQNLYHKATIERKLEKLKNRV